MRALLLVVFIPMSLFAAITMSAIEMAHPVSTQDAVVVYVQEHGEPNIIHRYLIGEQDAFASIKLPFTYQLDLLTPFEEKISSSLNSARATYTYETYSGHDGWITYASAIGYVRWDTLHYKKILDAPGVDAFSFYPSPNRLFWFEGKRLSPPGTSVPVWTWPSDGRFSDRILVRTVPTLPRLVLWDTDETVYFVFDALDENIPILYVWNTASDTFIEFRDLALPQDIRNVGTQFLPLDGLNGVRWLLTFDGRVYDINFAAGTSQEILIPVENPVVISVEYPWAYIGANMWMTRRRINKIGYPLDQWLYHINLNDHQIEQTTKLNFRQIDYAFHYNDERWIVYHYYDWDEDSLYSTTYLGQIDNDGSIHDLAVLSETSPLLDAEWNIEHGILFYRYREDHSRSSSERSALIDLDTLAVHQMTGCYLACQTYWVGDYFILQLVGPEIVDLRTLRSIEQPFLLESNVVTAFEMPARASWHTETFLGLLFALSAAAMLIRWRGEKGGLT